MTTAPTATGRPATRRRGPRGPSRGPGRGLGRGLGRVLGHAALIAVLAGTLAGCLKIDGDLRIEGDTVSGTVVTALDEEQAELLQLNPEDVFADQELGLGGLDGVTTAPYDQGGWTGTEYTFDRVSLTDLNQMSEGDPDGLRITRDPEAGTYEFHLVLDFSFLADLEEQIPTDPEAPDVDPQAMLETFETTVAVTFPGEVTEHNGELSGTTVSWAPEPGERAELRAVARDPNPGESGGSDGSDGSEDPSDPGQSGQPGSPGGTAPPDAEQDPAAVTDDDSGGSSGVGALIVVGVLAALAAGGVAGWLVFRSRRNREPGEAVE